MSALQTTVERLDALQRDLDSAHENPDVPGALSFCEQHDLSPLSFGGQRLALDLTDTKIAKVAWRRGGLSSNQVEWRLWESALSPLREMLAPVFVMTPGGVLIQGRCLPVAYEAAPGAESIVRALASHGVVDAAINLGFYHGRVVCYDFALLRPELAVKVLA